MDIRDIAPSTIARWLEDSDDEPFAEAFVMWMMIREWENENQKWNSDYNPEIDLTREKLLKYKPEDIGKLVTDILDEVILSEEIDESAWWKANKKENPK